MEAIGDVMLHHPQRWHLRVSKMTGLLSSVPASIVKDWVERAGLEGARRIAHHLALPFVAQDGTPTVPEITEFVLSRFSDDDEVFATFCSGAHSLQVYSGDIAGQHQREAEVARKFRDHPLRRISEWAIQEEHSSQQSAEHWRERDAIWRTE